MKEGCECVRVCGRMRYATACIKRHEFFFFFLFSSSLALLLCLS